MMKTLVTGGGGFVGRHLVERLLHDGHEVRTLELPCPALSELERQGVQTIAGDLRAAETVNAACRGMDVVFHVAALAAPWGTREAFWSINVTGTDNVIAACRAAGVRRLVHVSSPSAVFDGQDQVMLDESQPYPTSFLSLYSETKAVSEQHALAANGPDLQVVAIRPHAMWGPRDRHLLPRIVNRAKRGKMIQVGDGKNIISTLYIDNAVEALILASRAENAAGKVYFVTNDEPGLLWEFVRGFLSSLGLPGPKAVVPYPVASAMGVMYEAAWSLFRLKGEPPLTRYTAAELAKTHTYSIAAAKKDLGFKPRVSIEEGTKRLLDWIEDYGRQKYINQC